LRLCRLHRHHRFGHALEVGGLLILPSLLAVGPAAAGFSTWPIKTAICPEKKDAIGQTSFNRRLVYQLMSGSGRV
jgi:hypothetical protein